MKTFFKMEKTKQIVTRYISSTNEDYVGDFIAIANYMENNKEQLPTEELQDLEVEIAKHFHSLVIQHNDQFKDVIKIENYLQVKDVKERLEELLHTNNQETHKAIWEYFNEKLRSVDLPTKVSLLFWEGVYSNRLKRQQAIANRVKRENDSFSSYEEMECVKHAIEELKKAQATTPEQLAQIYLQLGSRLMKDLETMVENKQDRERNYIRFFSTYKNLLSRLELENGMDRVFSLTNEELENLLTTDILNATDNDKKMEVAKKWEEVLKYRQTTHRSSEEWLAKTYNSILLRLA